MEENENLRFRCQLIGSLRFGLKDVDIEFINRDDARSDTRWKAKD